jgi:hypothetical protein
MVFYPTLFSGFQRMQADPGDTLLNHYILEHLFRWVADRDYIGGLWSPPMMYPYQGALAFSDNLFAAGPFYWMFRVFAPPDIAFQLWMVAMFALDFASFCWLGRKLGAGAIVSATAAFLFAFGMPRAAQLGHQQLLPQFYTPLALGWYWELLRKPSLKAMGLALLFTYLQVMAGIYLGWFLLFSLALFMPILLLLSDVRPYTFRALIGSGVRTWAVVACWGGATAVSLMPYLRAQEIVGVRNFDEVDTMLPRLSSWFLSFHGSIYASWLNAESAGLPMVHEHWMFTGFGVWIMVAAGIWALARGKIDKPLRPLMCAAGLTFVAIVVVSLRFPGGFSLWATIYETVPGAGAIRAVSRIWLIAYPYALLFGLVGFQSLVNRRMAPAAKQTAVVTSLLLFSVGEQVLFDVPHFDKRQFLEDVSDIEPLLSDGCDFAYVTHPSRPFQLRAMWAGLRANIPVVNGTSGNYPPNYPYPAESVDQVVDWLLKAREDIAGDLCIVLPSEIDAYRDRYRHGSQSPRGKWQSFYVRVP